MTEPSARPRVSEFRSLRRLPALVLSFVPQKLHLSVRHPPASPRACGVFPELAQWQETDTENGVPPRAGVMVRGGYAAPTLQAPVSTRQRTLRSTALRLPAETLDARMECVNELRVLFLVLKRSKCYGSRRVMSLKRGRFLQEAKLVLGLEHGQDLQEEPQRGASESEGTTSGEAGSLRGTDDVARLPRHVTSQAWPVWLSG